MTDNIEMTPLNPPERSRTYRFPGGEFIALKDVSGFCARPSGSHRLATEDGRLHIVPPGWIHLEIDCDGWTV